MRLLKIKMLSAIFLLVGLQGCISKSLTLASYPSLNYEEMDNEIYSLHDLNWVLSNDEVDILVSIDNHKVLNSSTEIFNISTNVQGSRSPNVGEEPFIIILGIKSKGVGFSLNTSNSSIVFQDKGKSLEASLVQVAHKNEEVDCLLYGATQKTPSVVSIDIPSKFKLVGPDNLMGWKCIKYTFNIKVPDPIKKFKLMVGDIINENKNEVLYIYFGPKKYESIRTN